MDSEPLALEPTLPPLSKENREGSPRWGWKSLAQLITRRTTDLLAICLIVFVAWSFVSTTWKWWNPQDQTSPPEFSFETGEAVELRFGEGPWRVIRKEISASKEVAQIELWKLCEAALGEPGEPIPYPASKNARFIRETKAGKLLELGSGIPIVMGVREKQGLVCWGCMLPIGNQNWSLLVFHHGVEKNEHYPKGFSIRTGTQNRQLPIPPDCRHLLTLGDLNQQGWFCFEGEHPEGWADFFSSALETEGWSRTGEWTRVNGMEGAVFLGEGSRIQVLIDRDAQAETATGMIIVEPSTEE